MKKVKLIQLIKEELQVYIQEAEYNIDSDIFNANEQQHREIMDWVNNEDNLRGWVAANGEDVLDAVIGNLYEVVHTLENFQKSADHEDPDAERRLGQHPLMN
jgi:hypothetical protein